MRASACCSRAVCRPSEQYLDHANVVVLFEQMGGEAVPQGMRRHPLADLGALGRGFTAATYLARRHRADRVATRKQPPLWTRNAIPIAQQLQQLRREHRIAILAPLALLDAKHHALGVDVGYLQ